MSWCVPLRGEVGAQFVATQELANTSEIQLDGDGLPSVLYAMTPMSTSPIKEPQYQPARGMAPRVNLVASHRSRCSPAPRRNDLSPEGESTGAPALGGQ